jgi:membrane fusion protein, macrolide-specific efflux system
MRERPGQPWPIYVLALLCVGAIVAAVLVVGPVSGSTSTVTRTATVAQGVVQSTVSGSGNLQAVSQLNLGFKTSGTVTQIYVTQGGHVTEGQLLAELNPKPAEVTLEQSKASLQAAEASLAQEEETDGETSVGQGSSGTGASRADASAAAAAGVREDISYIATPATDTTPPTGASTQTTPPTAPTPPTTTTTTTTQATGSPTSTSSPTQTTSSEPTRTTGKSKSTSTSPRTTTPAQTTSPESKRGESGGSRSGGSTSGSTTSSSSTTGSSSTGGSGEGGSSKATISQATREANIASARAAVKSDKLTVESDEQAVADTKLYAPRDGTIVSLSGEVGETVSGTGTTKAAAASSSSGSAGTSSSPTGASSAAGSRSASASSSADSSDSSGSGSSGSSFAVLSDLSSMQLVVPLSESEISHVKVGQIATVTVEALEGRKLAAHVAEIAILSTSDSGVVSYDVTFALDQMDAGLKPGMSATAEVVVKQAEGVNVPTSAISADTVTVVRGGQHVRQRVVTGLAGNSSTIVLSGLKVGETVVLPTATSTGASSLTSRLSKAFGGGGLGGGGLAGGGATFFRGGG